MENVDCEGDCDRSDNGNVGIPSSTTQSGNTIVTVQCAEQIMSNIQSNPVITNPRGNGISFVIAGFRYTGVLDIFESMNLCSLLRNSMFDRLDT